MLIKTRLVSRCAYHALEKGRENNPNYISQENNYLIKNAINGSKSSSVKNTREPSWNPPKTEKQ